MAANLAMTGILEKMTGKDKDYRYMAMSDLLNELSKDSFKPDSDLEIKLSNIIIQQLDDAAGDVSGLAVKCLTPLVKKVSEACVVEMANKLCDKLVNGKDHHRDIASIALKTIVADVATQSLAQPTLVAATPQLIKGITGQIIMMLKCLVTLSPQNLQISANLPYLQCWVLYPLVLDSLVDPLQKTINFKPKQGAVKQEVDRNEDMIRCALRAIASLNRISGGDCSLKFKNLMNGDIKISCALGKVLFHKERMMNMWNPRYPRMHPDPLMDALLGQEDGSSGGAADTCKKGAFDYLGGCLKPLEKNRTMFFSWEDCFMVYLVSSLHL